MTVAEISECCHISERAVRRQLDRLVATGLVQEHPGERDGLSPGRPPSRFAPGSPARAKLKQLLVLLSTPLPPSPR